MKRTLLVAFLSFLSLSGFSQSTIWGYNSFVGIYGGIGLAAAHNYDIGISGGFEYVKGIAAYKHGGTRFGLGADVFYQSFSLLYDREQDGARHGFGNAGAMVRHKSAYIFLTPKFDVGIGEHQNVHTYITAGVGFKMSGYDSLRKWDHSYTTSGVGNYDSSLDMSKNIKSMPLRFGFGFKEFIYLGSHWRFTITQDFSFLGSSITGTGGLSDPSRTKYTPLSLNPFYFSLQIGIMRTRHW